MSDKPRGINPEDFKGDVFVNNEHDPIGSLIINQAVRALGVHNRERYESPDDDPALKLSFTEGLRRVALATQDPIFQERMKPLEDAGRSGSLLPEQTVREISINAWDRVHDYMIANDPTALLAQARRQARSKRGPNIT